MVIPIGLGLTKTFAFKGTTKAFFKGIGRVFVKGKGQIKKGITFFKEMKKALGGPLNAFYQMIEAFGLLNPLFKVLSAVIKLFSAGFLMELMPLFMEFLAIITDPEYQAAVRELGALFALYLRPMLQAIVWLMQQADWGALTEFLEHIHWALESWQDMNASGILKGIAMAVEDTIIKFQAFIWVAGLFGDAIQWLIDLMKKVGAIRGGSGGGSKGTVGGAIIKAIGSMVGGAYQHGTPYVPQSGLYHLTKGEAVTSAGENAARGDQMDRLIGLQEEMIEYQKDQIKFMKYGV